MGEKRPLSLVIGIDVGTTSTKAGAYTADGAAICTAAIESRLLRRPGGGVEQDPRELLDSVYAAIPACLQAGGLRGDDVVALALTGQMAGVMGIDADWRPVTPYDSWLDTRCSPQLRWLAAEHGDAVMQRTGCPPMVNHAPKMLWWRDEHPADYERIAAFVMPAVYVAGAITGLTAADAFIDHTYLHFTGLADARTGTWSPELIGALGLDAAKLPAILTPEAEIGRLSRPAARRSGLRAGTIVAAGLGDTAAGAFGAGIVRSGQLLDTAGTAAVLIGSVEGFHPDPGRGLIGMRGVQPGQWLPLNYVGGGGMRVPWLSALLDGDGGQAALRDLLDDAARVAAGADGLLFLPHLDGRIVPPAPAMRGGWLGLQPSHGRGHLARSILESIAFEYATYLRSMRRLHPDVDFTDARVIGGGARSALWNAIKADVLGVSYERVAAEETATRGAALVAAVAGGLLADAAEVAAQVPVGERVEPDPARHESYAPIVDRYAHVIDLLAEHPELMSNPSERHLVA